MDLFSSAGLVSVYSVLVGIMILTWWIIRFRANQVPKIREAPKETIFHVAAEILTATLLILSGLGLAYGFEWARTLLPVSLGMLVYAVVNIAGVHARQNYMQMVITLMLIATLTVISILVIS